MSTQKKTRLDYNIEILTELTLFFSKNPDQRFGQALANLGIVDTQHGPHSGILKWENEYYTESEETLNRIKSKEN